MITDQATQGAAQSARASSERNKFLQSVSPALEQFMTRMGPCGVGEPRENISLTGAMMCQIMMLNSVIERRGNRLLEAHGLTLPQWLALGCISHAGEGGITHSQIGQRLMLSKAPITGTVDRLERAGLVERRGDARDRRISLAVVTAKGIEMWWSVKNTLHSQTDALVSQCLSTDEQETLLRLIGRLQDAFSAETDTSETLATKNEDALDT